MFEIYVKAIDDEIIFKVWDDAYWVKEMIGFAVAKVSSLCINGGGELEFNIYNKQEKVGSLFLITSFTP